MVWESALNQLEILLILETWPHFENEEKKINWNQVGIIFFSSSLLHFFSLVFFRSQLFRFIFAFFVFLLKEATSYLYFVSLVYLTECVCVCCVCGAIESCHNQFRGWGPLSSGICIGRGRNCHAWDLCDTFIIYLHLI